MSSDTHQALNPAEVTELLDEIQSSPELFDRLMPLVYDDMKRIGRAQRRRLGAGDTLQTTALVHEAFLKLRQNAHQPIDNRLHLQRLAACVMRQLIFDYARKQLTAKRGGDQVRATWNEDEHGLLPEDLDRIMAVEKAIDAMAESDQRMAECVSANLLASYTVEEIGDMLGISSRTVVRDLRRARAWLQVELAHLEPVN
jgi:RNA polymerase sigma factor (TIGR02999 family)